MLFLNDKVINFLVQEKNLAMLNVPLQILMKCNSQFKDWKPSNADETKLFIGFSIHVDAVNLPRLNDYWSSTTYSELILEAKP